MGCLETREKDAADAAVVVAESMANSSTMSSIEKQIVDNQRSSSDTDGTRGGKNQNKKEKASPINNPLVESYPTPMEIQKKTETLDEPRLNSARGKKDKPKAPTKIPSKTDISTTDENATEASKDPEDKKNPEYKGRKSQAKEGKGKGNKRSGSKGRGKDYKGDKDNKKGQKGRSSRGTQRSDRWSSEGQQQHGYPAQPQQNYGDYQDFGQNPQGQRSHGQW